MSHALRSDLIGAQLLFYGGLDEFAAGDPRS